ncbi:MAG TPA: peptidylprolyl isomerase [Bacteroidales bacterium]|nr:peptidylprolyl isomerase [Bacteroidales bacterium]HPM88397.1 peptidylprolyl isomerase [Bacteroidales bacterium]HQM69272.1 peptidylprolyl isomerase [Bacteroidales bacterium]
MKIGSSLLISVLSLIFPALCNAQELNDKILMNVAGNDVTAGEFIRMLNKSSEPGKIADVDEYLGQYINFKLKVADAVSEGIDTTRAFRNELSGYRNQLAQNYLTDPEAKEKLLQKTYQRSLEEINGWHILVNCPEGSKPEDTLLAWQKAAGIRERIINGEPFEQVARSTSDDPSVRINGGNLGFFTVFQMISPFEDAAYSLKKGAVSDPVRTPYGYHIINVADKRPSRGKVLVAHIMKLSPPGAGEEETKAAEKSINELYKQLQDGASFTSLAKQYSDDKESAVRGGKLNWFGAGEIISDFAEAAFSISDTGSFTLPVRSPYGWHIIKLLDKKPHGSYEEMRSFLESKINQSYLNSLSKKTFIDKLKKEYNYEINTPAYNWFIRNTDTLIIQGLKKYVRKGMPPGNLYTFAGQGLLNSDFASYIENRGSRIITSDPVHFIRESLETILSDQIIKYEDSILETKYPDFRYLINEFHDGILLFDISERKIWNRVQEDSTGLLQYYEENKINYPGKRAMEAIIYSLKDVNSEKKLYSAFRKYSRKQDTEKLMKDKFNTSGDSLLVINEGTWIEGQDPELDKIKWQEGIIRTRINNYPSVLVIKKIIEPSPLPFEEVRGDLMADYQVFLENQWIDQLKKKYPVKIDSQILNEIKNSLKNE